MHRMTRTFVVGCCAFLAGLALGSLQGSSGIFGSRRAVSVDFCFILQNPDVIGSRSFITRATIVSAFPHGSVLESDSCPKMGASFTEKLDRQDFSAELNERFKNDPSLQTFFGSSRLAWSNEQLWRTGSDGTGNNKAIYRYWRTNRVFRQRRFVTVSRIWIRSGQAIWQYAIPRVRPC